MRYFLLTGLAASLLSLPVLAQTTTPPAHTTTPPTHTTTTPSGTVPAHPAPSTAIPDTHTTAPVVSGGVAGANSFTEAQARGRLEKDGFTNVSPLVKDKDGIWRGRATKGAHEQAVGVDYKGNIVAN